MSPLFAKKSLGQNFLNSPGAIKKMVAGADVQPGDVVLEVGPGKGVLTRALLDAGAEVIAIEKDDRLITTLNETFKKEIADKKFVLVHGDALLIDPATLTTATGTSLKEHHFKIIANIPYYITGAFFKKYFSEVIQPSTLVVMVQKEVAERIARDPKESILSISVKVYGIPHYIDTVIRGSFFPIPNVDSAILSVTEISKKNFIGFSDEQFFEIVKTGFAHKRKKLLGNLRELFEDERLISVFTTNGLSTNIRAEDISLEQWISLVQTLTQA